MKAEEGLSLFSKDSTTKLKTMKQEHVKHYSNMIFNSC